MPQTILVTGATGYIASRLIPRLLDAGYQVRCLARQPARLKGRNWYPAVQVMPGDVTRLETLPEAMRGVSAAYYLVHNMAAGEGYHKLDLQAARNFAQTARDAGVQHIIYLGGLADPNDPGLALHMKSRLETGEALREAGVPVTEFRAGVIVGPGSVSFEMIRFIAEQFPLLVGPAWLKHRSQPIATSNVLDYLIEALNTPAARGMTIEIGIQEARMYIDIMTGYARMRGLVSIPVLVPWVPLSFMTYLIDLLTPVDASYAFPLVEGLQNDSLVRDRSPLALFPQVRLLDYGESVQLALADTHPARMERVWLDMDREAVQIKHEGMFIDYHRERVNRPTEGLFESLKNLAGSGLRVGLLHTFEQDELTNDRLRLKVAQKLPGEAWLEWQVKPDAAGAMLEQTFFFAPRGLAGFLGWYLFNPIQRRSFERLIHRLAWRA